jgi:hypothetical protein
VREASKEANVGFVKKSGRRLQRDGTIGAAIHEDSEETAVIVYQMDSFFSREER